MRHRGSAWRGGGRGPHLGGVCRDRSAPGVFDRFFILAPCTEYASLLGSFVSLPLVVDDARRLQQWPVRMDTA
ncbi:hypothetical protein WJX72_012380 [[Myrmecia] bisecta]|uniref:Uncharacterized protein n=1 Tax=[Myrmecia] bisecta TaxID=41462 RepID=A0AAW1PY04_9CHLO